MSSDRPVMPETLSDELQHLWAPHRMKYIKGEGKPHDDTEGDHCPFCRVPGLPDEEGLVVARGAEVYAVLNLYPYNTGHLLVCPYRHIADLTEARLSELTEMGAFTQRAMTVIRQTMGAHGFNIGLNQGPVAGAGIAAHLHQHVVPRWGGDANFMPLIGRTKVHPQDLPETRAILAAAW